MDLLFFIMLLIPFITIILSGNCMVKPNEFPNDHIFRDYIEPLSGNLLCLSLQFLPLSDYKLFFKKYAKSAPEETSICRVKFEERHYSGVVHEFFNFVNSGDKFQKGRWFPQTFKQFASWTQDSSPYENTFQAILYKNGFFEIISHRKFDYDYSQVDQNDWNQNIESFFIKSSYPSGHYARETIINLFKKDKKCLPVKVMFQNQQNVIISRPNDEASFFVHNLVPSFFFAIKNNKIDMQPNNKPMFHEFDCYPDTTFYTKTCERIPETSTNKIIIVEKMA